MKGDKIMSATIEELTTFDKYVFKGENKTLSECARVFREINDKVGTWHTHIDKLAENENKANQVGITIISKNIITAYIESTNGKTQDDIEYNKVANKVYDTSKLWVILYQNLQNTGMDYAWDALSEGIDSLYSFEANQVTKPLKERSSKINNMFKAVARLGKILESDYYTLNDLMATKGRFKDDLFVICKLLRKIIICMKYTWLCTLNDYPGIHKEHWYEATYKGLFNTGFINFCNNILSDITEEVRKLKSDIEKLRSNGYTGTISIHPSCTLGYMGIPDIHHIVPAAVKRFLQNPETKPGDLPLDDLYFYDACSCIDYPEHSIIYWFNK